MYYHQDPTVYLQFSQLHAPQFRQKINTIGKLKDLLNSILTEILM